MGRPVILSTPAPERPTGLIGCEACTQYGCSACSKGVRDEGLGAGEKQGVPEMCWREHLDGEMG